jgi:hypothetical protein
VKPRLRTLPKTGDADKYELVFTLPNGREFADEIWITSYAGHVNGHAQELSRLISRHIHQFNRWVAKEFAV